MLRLTNNGPQTIPSGVLTRLYWNTYLTRDHDELIMPFAVSDLPIPSRGTYSILATIYPAISSQGNQRVLTLHLNGYSIPFASTGVQTGNLSVNVAGLLRLNAGDLIDARFFQDTGADMDVAGEVPNIWISYAKVR